MRLHRFYTTRELTTSLIYTEESHIHQWKNVFRYDSGGSIILFGDGFEHTYTIGSITKKEAILSEQSRAPSRIQSEELSLGIAIIKRDNFELVLQKCTEIGVTSFIPLVTDRSLQKMFTRERMEKILIEATEQSGWGRVPELLETTTFDIVLKQNVVVLDNSGQDKLSNNTSTLLVGPEGGWSPRELSMIEEAKKEVWSLKTGVLRAETAAIVATGIIKNTR